MANALDDAVDLRRPLQHSPLVLGKREEPEAPSSRHGDLQAEGAGTDRGRLAHDAEEQLAQVVQVGVVARALHDQGLLRGHLRVRHAPDAVGALWLLGFSVKTGRKFGRWLRDPGLGLRRDSDSLFLAPFRCAMFAMLGTAVALQPRLASSSPSRCTVHRTAQPRLLLSGRAPVQRAAHPLLLLDDRNQSAAATWRDDTVVDLRDRADRSRDAAAYSLMVTPAWIDVAVGSIAFLLLNVAIVSTFGDSVTSRMVALGGFVGLQQLVGLPPSEWLRLDDEPAAVDPNPLFQSRSPLAGATFATTFALCVALAAQLCGLEWIPGPRPWPEPSRAALLLLIAPLSEEAFFRAYLMTALERAGAPANAALLASAAGFALYHVPLAEMLRDGSLALAFYESLGLYLGFLYQRSGRSLPLAVVTHASFNAIVTALRAAQVGSVLPFQ